MYLLSFGFADNNVPSIGNFFKIMHELMAAHITFYFLTKRKIIDNTSIFSVASRRLKSHTVDFIFIFESAQKYFIFHY